MQSSEDRARRDAMVDRKMMAMGLLVHPSRRRIRHAGSEARVGSATGVVTDPFLKDSTKMPLIEQDHPIQALSPNGADQPLAMRVRSGRPRRRLQHRQTGAA